MMRRTKLDPKTIISRTDDTIVTKELVCLTYIYDVYVNSKSLPTEWKSCDWHRIADDGFVAFDGFAHEAPTPSDLHRYLLDQILDADPSLMYKRFIYMGGSVHVKI